MLTTDPWLSGQAYFGSWGPVYEVPDEQRRAILDSAFVWLSHGHPDHLDVETLMRMQGQTVLLADHAGGRIRRDLEEAGFRVRVLPDRKWVSLSPGIRVFCIGDYFQDSVLLVDIHGRLLVNLNDALDRSWGLEVRRQVRRFPKSYLLKSFGFSVGEMQNFFDEQGNRLKHRGLRKGLSVGAQIEFYTDLFGTTDAIPFSSFHAYQREDSIWGNAYRSFVHEIPVGFEGRRARLHPPFVRVDCRTDRVEALSPRPLVIEPRDPRDFGDDWSEPLEKSDVQAIARYFRAIGSLARHVDFVRFVVGGEEHTIELSSREFRRGVSFATPRASLMTAIGNRVFDDILLGNFARTTLHGSWPETSLFPCFTPFVAKYADNGLARSPEEVATYFAAYRARAPFAFLLHQLEQQSESRIRRALEPDGLPFRLSKRLYLWLKRPGLSLPPGKRPPQP